MCRNGYKHHNSDSLDIMSLDSLKSFSGNFSVSFYSKCLSTAPKQHCTYCMWCGVWSVDAFGMLHKGKGFLLGQRVLVVISVQSKYQLLLSYHSQHCRIHCLSRREMFTWKFPLWSLKRSTKTYFGSGIAGITDFWSLQRGKKSTNWCDVLL